MSDKETRCSFGRAAIGVTALAPSVVALGPPGVVFTSAPRSDLRFGDVLTKFEADSADMSKQVPAFCVSQVLRPLSLLGVGHPSIVQKSLLLPSTTAVI